MDPTALIEAIRRATPTGIWSAGVKLSRADAVAIESQSADKVLLRVRAPGRPVAPTVVLLPGELDWDCDCPGRMRPCDHIVAAALWLGRADSEGGEASPDRKKTTAASWAQVGYRLSHGDGGVKVTRVILRGGGGGGAPVETVLTTSLAILRNRPEGADLHLEESDLRADLLLETGARGVLQPSKLDALLSILAGARGVTLDGRPVVVAEEPLRPHAVVADRPGEGRTRATDGDDVTITILRDGRISEVIAAGVARAGDAIHKLAETELTGAYL